MSMRPSIAFHQDHRRFRLDEWIFQQANLYRAQDTEAADWLAEILEKIAHQIPEMTDMHGLRTYVDVAVGWVKY